MPSPLNSCCPTGYTYNITTGLCETIVPVPIIPGCYCYTISVTITSGSPTAVVVMDFHYTDCAGAAQTVRVTSGTNVTVCASSSSATNTLVSNVGANSYNTAFSRGANCYNNSGTPSCMPGSGTKNTAPAMACQCCPKGSTYVDQDGYFIQGDPTKPGYGSRMQISNPTPYTGLTSRCVTITNIAWAIPASVDPVDCPCCHANTSDWYNSLQGECVDLSGALYDPIPCIPCVCVDPPPPPPCEGCQEQSGQHIHFAYNPFVKNCTDCDKQNFEPPTDPKLNCFMPYFIILPNTNNFTTE